MNQFTPQNTLTDLNTAQTAMVEWVLRHFHGATLVKVQSVHNSGLTLGTLTVQPLLNAVTTDQQGVVLPALSCLYSRAQGGNAALICDPVPGDIGIMVTTSQDRQNQTLTANAQPSTPPTVRKHNMADGVWLLTLTRATPSTYIQVLDGQINLKTPGAVALNCGGNCTATVGGNLSTTVSGSVTMQAPTIRLVGAVTVEGTFSQVAGVAGSGGSFEGAMVGSATITTTGEGTFKGVSVSTHTHYVPAAPGESNKPS